MRQATKAFLGIVFGIVQIGWFVLCMLIFKLMGYDGGGFAGGVEPIICVGILALPLILAVVVWATIKMFSLVSKL